MINLGMNSRKEIVCPICYTPLSATVEARHYDVPVEWNPAGENYRLSLESGQIADEKIVEFYCDGCGFNIGNETAIQGAIIFALTLEEEANHAV